MCVFTEPLNFRGGVHDLLKRLVEIETALLIKEVSMGLSPSSIKIC